MAYYIISKEDETYDLYHYGVMSMKWGYRRYQDENGRLTAAGRYRYRKAIANGTRSAKTGEATSYGKKLRNAAVSGAIIGGVRGATAVSGPKSKSLNRARTKRAVGEAIGGAILGRRAAKNADKNLGTHSSQNYAKRGNRKTLRDISNAKPTSSSVKGIKEKKSVNKALKELDNETFLYKYGITKAEYRLGVKNSRKK